MLLNRVQHLILVIRITGHVIMMQLLCKYDALFYGDARRNEF